MNPKTLLLQGVSVALAGTSVALLRGKGWWSMGSHNKFLVALLTSAAWLTSSCGPHAGINSRKETSKQSQDWSETLEQNPNSSNSDSCTASPNLLPKTDWFNDGRMVFTVCRGGARDRFNLKGRPSIGTRICVIPGSVNASNIVEIWRDASTNVPLSQCKEVSTVTSTEFVFNGTNINYAFAVEEPHLAQMIHCLAAGNPNLCPNTGGATYSRGKFAD